MNRLAEEDAAAHDWYRFVLSYPAHLVRHYLDKFSLDEGATVLDPFCGTGTTLVECKKHRINSIGIEAHPMTAFASSVKVDWSPDPGQLIADAEEIAGDAIARLARDGVPDVAQLALREQPAAYQDAEHLRALPTDSDCLLLKDSISPGPMHKALTLLDLIDGGTNSKMLAHERLAFAKSVVFSSSNLNFGPEVGVGKPRPNAEVVGPWLANVQRMADDLAHLQERCLSKVPARVIHADAREAACFLAPQSIDAVICSPPYPNEKDYTRTTRLESVLLGFVTSKSELQQVKKGLVRSNTRTVYKDDADDRYIAHMPEIQRIADEIEQRRLDLGKTSGFERMYPRVTKLYFGGMARHLTELRTVLRPGAQLAYVVGDQASYLRVMIRTGQLLADIAEHLGYEVQSLDLFRTRLSTATGEQLREEVVVLRWPGFAAGNER